MKTVKQLLDIKGSKVWCITPDTRTYDALEQMADKKIGALLVMDGDNVMGIFSEPINGQASRKYFTLLLNRLLRNVWPS